MLPLPLRRSDLPARVLRCSTHGPSIPLPWRGLHEGLGGRDTYYGPFSKCCSPIFRVGRFIRSNLPHWALPGQALPRRVAPGRCDDIMMDSPIRQRRSEGTKWSFERGHRQRIARPFPHQFVQNFTCAQLNCAHLHSCKNSVVQFCTCDGFFAAAFVDTDGAKRGLSRHNRGGSQFCRA